MYDYEELIEFVEIAEESALSELAVFGSWGGFQSVEEEEVMK